MSEQAPKTTRTRKPRAKKPEPEPTPEPTAVEPQEPVAEPEVTPEPEPEPASQPEPPIAATNVRSRIEMEAVCEKLAANRADPSVIVAFTGAGLQLDAEVESMTDEQLMILYTTLS